MNFTVPVDTGSEYCMCKCEVPWVVRFKIWRSSCGFIQWLHSPVIGRLVTCTRRTARLSACTGRTSEAKTWGRFVRFHWNAHLLHVAKFFHLSRHCAYFLSFSSVHNRRQVLWIPTTASKSTCVKVIQSFQFHFISLEMWASHHLHANPSQIEPVFSQIKSSNSH